MNKNKHMYQVRVLIVLMLLVQFWGSNTQAQSVRDSADYYYETQDYLKALSQYEKLNRELPDAVINFRIGVCMYNLKDQRANSGVYFEKATFGMPQDMYTPLTVDPEVLESFYYLGQHYHQEKEYDIAIMMYQTYQNYRGMYVGVADDLSARKFSRQEIDNLIRKSVYAMEHEDDLSKVKVEILGEGVNTAYPDYGPIISADGSKLIFTSRRPGTGGLTDPRGEYFEDIYITLMGPKGWIKPKGISANINTDLHDAGIGLSINGDDLMMFRTNKSLTGGDIYHSRLSKGEWSEPELLTSSQYSGENVNKGVNTSYIEPSACMNREGDVLIFSSNRPGGYGGLDLYRVVKLPDGQWSFAVNLGPTINTPFDEDAPFLHPDNKSLFFSSKGHRNMGGYDIFKTELRSGSGNLRSDIGLLWTVPENMKAPINSVSDDIYYVQSPDGKKGYFSSNREGGMGRSDIYEAILPARERTMIVVKGTVISLDDNKPLSARLTVLDQESHILQGEYNTNPETGEYVMILSSKLRYRMIVEADGHYSITENYLLVSFQEDLTVLTKQISMHPIPIIIRPTTEYIYSYVLKEVHFEAESDKIVMDTDSAFSTLVQTMISNDSMIVEIAGHTDSEGAQEANLALSQKRAEAIKDYLILKGIEENRLVAKGYGESTPFTGNGTKEGRAANRRMEIRVIKE